MPPTAPGDIRHSRAPLDRCAPPGGFWAGQAAFLAGITAAEVQATGDVLAEAGFVMIEVPLNSPDPLRSIELLARRLGDRVLVGAGTVLEPVQMAAM